MIISHKYKFLFIGLPFSASSAISKELHQQYEAQPFLRKHSLYYEFNKEATKQEMGYFVFAVLRNPMEIVITTYEKMKSNAKGNFTNPVFFTENGGHITAKQRERFDFIINNNATFQQYFNKFYKKPYDNLSSLTIDYCDFVIRYENIDRDYLSALKNIGISNPKPLNVANKTLGKVQNDILGYYTDEIKDRAVSVFGPFMRKYNYVFPEQWKDVKPSLISIYQFRILSILRNINVKYIKRYSKINGVKGTIYGDMKINDSN